MAGPVVAAGAFDYSVAGPGAWFDPDTFVSNVPGYAAGWFDVTYLEPPTVTPPVPPTPAPVRIAVPTYSGGSLGGGGCSPEQLERIVAKRARLRAMGAELLPYCPEELEGEEEAEAEAQAARVAAEDDGLPEELRVRIAIDGADRAPELEPTEAEGPQADPETELGPEAAAEAETELGPEPTATAEPTPVAAAAAAGAPPKKPRVRRGTRLNDAGAEPETVRRPERDPAVLEALAKRRTRPVPLPPPGPSIASAVFMATMVLGLSVLLAKRRKGRR